MNAGSLRFELLGPVRAYRGAEPVDLGPLVQRAVLAVLLLHADRPVPVQEIVAALWNGDPPENGVDVVQRCIGGLRRALDPGRTSLLTLTENGYVLRVGDNTLDTGLFRAALAQARDEHRTGTIGTATDEIRHQLERWAGEPLAGLTGPVFDAARARLIEERVTASEMLAASLGGVPTPQAPPSTRIEPPARPQSLAPTRTGPARPEPLAPTRTEPARPEPLAPTRTEPARPQPPAPTRTEPARPQPLAPTRTEPARPEPLAPTRLESAPQKRTPPTRIEPGLPRPPAPSGAGPARQAPPAPPTRIEPPARPEPPAPTRVERAWPEPPAPTGTGLTPQRPPAAPTRMEPAPQQPPPTRSEPRVEDPGYPDAVDPWEGHDLLPPHSR